MRPAVLRNLLQFMQHHSRAEAPRATRLERSTWPSEVFGKEGHAGEAEPGAGRLPGASARCSSGPRVVRLPSPRALRTSLSHSVAAARPLDHPGSRADNRCAVVLPMGRIRVEVVMIQNSHSRVFSARSCRPALRTGQRRRRKLSVR